MTSNIQLHLEPTFPLDGQEIERRVRKSALAEMVPWGLLGLLFTVGLAFPLGVTGILLGLGGTGFGLQRYYKRNTKKVEARVVCALIRENNREQDQQLQGVVTDLQRRGLHAYAAALGKFVLLKQRIESNLHRSAYPSVSNQQLDNLIDRICSLTCTHLSKLSVLDVQVAEALTASDETTLKRLVHERGQILIDIQRAYYTLYESLDSLLAFRASAKETDAPPTESESASMTAMDKAIHQLEQENALLKRITHRVQTDLSLPPAPSEIFDLSDTEKTRSESPDVSRDKV